MTTPVISAAEFLARRRLDDEYAARRQCVDAERERRAEALAAFEQSAAARERLHEIARFWFRTAVVLAAAVIVLGLMLMR